MRRMRVGSWQCAWAGHDPAWLTDHDPIWGTVCVRYCRGCEKVFTVVTHRPKVAAIQAIQTSEGNPSSDFHGAIE